MRNFLLILLTLLLAALVGTGVYFLTKRPITNNTNSTAAENTGATKSGQPSQTPLLSGTLKKLPTDLKLFGSNNYSETPPSAAYYEAGTFTSQDYKDYKRIVAIAEAQGPGGPAAYVLATKNDLTYILDGDPALLTKYKPDEWQYPLSGFDTTKVISVAVLDSYTPQAIKLNDQFSLFKVDLVTTGSNILQTDFSSGYEKLPLENTDLTLRANIQGKAEIKDPADKESAYTSIENTYIKGDTVVYITDPTNLTFKYLLTTNVALKDYLDNKYNPTYQGYAGIHFANLAGPAPLYKKYDKSFPGACGIGQYGTDTVTGLTDSDLAPAGEEAGIKYYYLKDNNHPLIKLEYYRKLGAWTDYWKDYFTIPQPTYAEYVSKKPLLFIKDFWNRWVAVGEYDNMLPGGCGKPVVYLYPEKPTVVSVAFETQVDITRSMPTYTNGWKVLAQPDGTLTDLVPQYTNCSLTNTDLPGMAYADNACKANTYPYLYWSGNVINHEYPKLNEGWVVKAIDIESFLKSKLTYMGLTEKESTDMLSYWLPRIRGDTAPYYKISFFQNTVMDSFVPMSVTPKPDSEIRVFLDYTPLQTKPSNEMQPQKLEAHQNQRTGFTIVEWGGLIRY